MGIREQVQQYLMQSQYREFADQISDLVKQSVRIKTHPDPSLSQSHFGGIPHVPPGFEMPTWDITPFLRYELQDCEGRRHPDYPRWDLEIARIQARLNENTIVPLTYLGQIVLDEIPGLDLTTKFPRTGIIYFFYDMVNYPPAESLSSKGGCRCVYLDTLPDVIEPVLSYGKTQGLFPHCSLTFDVGWILAQDKLQHLEAWSGEDFTMLSGDLLERFALKLRGDEIPGSSMHQLLGYPSPVQDDEMERRCHLTSLGLSQEWDYSEDIEKGAKDWTLLAQFDSGYGDKNLGWNLGDVGRLFFWIKQQDLEQQDFSNIWFDLQSA